MVRMVIVRVICIANSLRINYGSHFILGDEGTTSFSKMHNVDESKKSHCWPKSNMGGLPAIFELLTSCNGLH